MWIYVLSFHCKCHIHNTGIAHIQVLKAFKDLICWWLLTTSKQFCEKNPQRSKKTVKRYFDTEFLVQYMNYCYTEWHVVYVFYKWCEKKSHIWGCQSCLVKTTIPYLGKSLTPDSKKHKRVISWQCIHIKKINN